MKALIIAAHPDDEVLGVGGTIARLASEGAAVTVLIVTEGCTAQYPGQPEMVTRKQNEARAAAAILGVSDVRFGPLPDMRLDTVAGVEINAVIEKVVREVKPEIVFTQAEHDVNADHGAVYQATLVACRPYGSPQLRELYTYYTPSSSEWGTQTFALNTYWDISQHLEKKIAAMRAYSSELRDYPHPRSAEALEHTAGHFGSAIGVRYAEAFRLIRQVRR